MQINLSKLMGIVTGIITILMIGGSGYFLFSVFFDGPQEETSPTLATLNVSIFGPKIQKAAAALVDPQRKISLKKKDIAFTESALYQSFTDLPEEVPLSDSRGRPDPFVPYVAP